jgi:hypothetical protein
MASCMHEGEEVGREEYEILIYSLQILILAL